MRDTLVLVGFTAVALLALGAGAFEKIAQAVPLDISGDRARTSWRAIRARRSSCSKRKSDCGYGACVLMPDDIVFALTYIQYNPDPEKHSIVGVWLPK